VVLIRDEYIDGNINNMEKKYKFFLIFGLCFIFIGIYMGYIKSNAEKKAGITHKSGIWYAPTLILVMTGLIISISSIFAMRLR